MSNIIHKPQPWLEAYGYQYLLLNRFYLRVFGKDNKFQWIVEDWNDTGKSIVIHRGWCKDKKSARKKCYRKYKSLWHKKQQ